VEKPSRFARAGTAVPVATATAQVAIVTHGSLAVGLLDAATMILGPQSGVSTLSLQPEDDPAGLEARLRKLLDDAPPGALILVDLFGATPANAAAALLRDRADVEIVSGVNLPMLVEVLARREGTPAGELAGIALAAGPDGTKDVGAIIRGALAKSQEGPSTPCQ
jgi:mannose PTS system EIIA component